MNSREPPFSDVNSYVDSHSADSFHAGEDTFLNKETFKQFVGLCSQNATTDRIRHREYGVIGHFNRQPSHGHMSHTSDTMVITAIVCSSCVNGAKSFAGKASTCSIGR